MIPAEPTSEFTPSGFDFEFAAPSDYARLYRLRGIQVVPAWMPGEPPRDAKGNSNWKRPYLKEWVEYQEAPVPDDKFAEWYGHSGKFVSRENMGMITGRASGNLFVIDLDLYKNLGAKEWWDTLMLNNNNMDLTTVEQVTGGGGSQKIYRAPPEWTAPTAKLPNGVDFRGQGGFAMLVPSLHESGNHYEWVDGQSPDDMPPTMAPDWLLAGVEALVVEHGGHVGGNGATRPHASPQGIYDGFGRLVDHRETRMHTMIWGAVLDFYRERYVMSADAEMPSEEASQAREEEKWLIYSQEIGPKADEAEIPANRGREAFHVKWRGDMRKWHGKVRQEALKLPPPKEGPAVSCETNIVQIGIRPAPASQLAYPFLDVDEIMDKPDPVWAVENLILEKSLGFIFGPPSSLKTFLALDLALSMTAKATSWWGRKINTAGAVIYLCREGTTSFKFRIQAWEQHRKLTARGTPFFLVEHPTNFMKPEDRLRVIATIDAVAAKAGVPIAAIMVDTVSRVLPGAKENQQEDMSLFIEACEVIQQRFGCIVVGVHHTNKNGGIRGSTVIPGAGDFLIETRRVPGAMVGSIVLEKVKDGEDGIELAFKVTKLDLGGIVPRSSLAVDPSNQPVQQYEAGPEWPDIAVCREILAEIDQQWWKGLPWCYATNSSRSAITNIVNRWQLARAVVKDMLAKWTATGVIEEVERDSKTHVKGYKKLTNI